MEKEKLKIAYLLDDKVFANEEIMERYIEEHLDEYVEFYTNDDIEEKVNDIMNNAVEVEMIGERNVKKI